MDLVSPALQLGIAGVGLVAEAFVIIRLYNDNKTLQSRIDVIQEARIAESQETQDKVAQPLSSISQTVNLLYDKLQVQASKRGKP